MAGKLFNIYSGNTGGVLSTSTTKVGSFGTTSDDFYSVNFDTGRKSIWTNNIEFGRAADWVNISGIPSWIGSDGVTWANVKDKPATATRWPYWSEILSKPAAIGSVTQPVYWDGSTFQLVNSVAPASHDHDDKYVKLDGTNVMSGDLTLNLGDLDRFIVFSYHNAVNPSSNSWRTGVLGTGSGENNFFVVQYQRINTNSSDWNTAFKIGQDTGTVTFTNNIKVGSYTVYHSGNLPAYPTVNNGALNLQASGTTKVTFYANQSGTSNFNIATGSANGTISVGGTDVAVKGLGSNAYTSTAYLPLAGGTMDEGAQIKRKGKGGAWIYGRDNALIRETSSSGYHSLFSLKTTDGSWELGEYNTSGWYNIPVFSYITDTNYNSGNNSATYQIKFPLASGTIALTADLTWSKIADKPATATRWPSWDEVTSKPSSFTPAAHDHTYLKKNFKSTGITNIPFTGEQFEYGILTGAATGVASPEDLTAFDSYSQVEYINLPWYSNLYGGQLMFGANSGKIGYRTIHNGTWTLIKEIIHSDNYTTYTVKKDGTGATGTWGISISGNAATATKLQTARTITINGSSKTFDGSGNISWSLADLNLPSNDHNHDAVYVKKAGDTMSGVLHLLGSQYADTAGTGALDLANSDIYGVNSIKFADLADSAGEGLQWYRDATHVDSLWVKNGVIYFSPNRTWGGSVTNNTVYHSGNDGTGSGLDADLLDGVHANGLFTNFSNKTVSGNKVLAATIGGTELTVGVEYANSSNTANSATTAAVLLTNNTSQNADSCYTGAPGLRFWRYNGTSSTTGQSGGDGWILSWSWNEGSVGGQIYLDDNPSKTMCIRGFNNSDSTFTTWSKILHTGNISPSLPISGNTIAVTVGGVTSSYITVPYATSAGNADTLDTFHANGLFQTFTNDATNNAVKIKIGNTEKSLVVGYATKAGDADKLDNIDSTGFLRYISHNAEWSATANTPTNLTAGIHKIHVSGVEYSSILTGYDYNGSYWQLWFHPSSGYSENIQYRATNCSSWKTILDSNNSSVSKSGETLSVKINGTTQSLTNTWRGITDSYNVDSPSSSTSLSQTGAKALYNALINGYANNAGNADTVDNKHADDFLYRLRRINLNASSNYVGMIPPAILELKSAGYPLYTDPEFVSGNNGIYVYNNSGGSDVTITRIDDNQTSGNSSGKILKIHSSSGTASPYGGGFYFATGGTVGKIHVCIFRAKIPSGYNVEWHSNSIGNGASNGWLTSTDGTGKWEWYAYIVEWGSSPSSTFFFTLNKKENVDWYLSYANVIDITNGAYDGLRTRYADYATSSGSASSVAWANITGKATSKTAWGQTFVDASGNIQSISGNMTSVGQVTPDGNATRDNGTSSANWATVYSYALRSNDNLTLRSGTSKDIIFQTNAGTEYMRLTSGGKLGIGTNSPNTTVHMKGDLLIDNDFSANDHGIFFRKGFTSSGKYNVSILAYDHNGNGETPDGLSINGYDGISFCTGSDNRNEVVRITGTTSNPGRVGIGTMSPTEKLHVSGGIIRIDSNNKYLTIGCKNVGFAHYITNSGDGHYFNHSIHADGDIYVYSTQYGIRRTGNIYGAGFYKVGSSNDYVLLGAGSHKQWSASKVANTIVVRTGDNYIYNGYYNSDISNEDSLTPGSVYFAQSGEGWIRKQSISKFADNLRSNEIISIDKSLTITEAWMDTGIVCDATTFPRGTGTYAVQVCAASMTSDSYYPYYSGIMTIYTSTTNSSGNDEVALHCAGHAVGTNYKRLYIRTQEQANPNYNKIQIAGSSNLSKAYTITFKFRKLI